MGGRQAASDSHCDPLSVWRSPILVSVPGQRLRSSHFQAIRSGSLFRVSEMLRPIIAVSIDDLIELHVSDMRLERCEPHNIEIEERRARKHLGEYFAGRDFTLPLKKADITKYKTFRVGEHAARSTINRELSTLRRCLTLANRDELLAVPIPEFERFDEGYNIRTGIIDDSKYHAILQFLPPHVQPVWCIAYRTGVREGELLKLLAEWLLPHWNKPCIEIPGFDAKGNRVTKSGRAHVIPLYHLEMRAFMKMVLANRNPKCPYQFQYQGKGLKSIRTAFENARQKAGLDGLHERSAKVIFHDTRRSAAIHMDEAGVDRKEAMEITGHLTESMYERYRIGKASQAIKTGQKLREFEAQRQRNHKFAYEFTCEACNRTSSGGSDDLVN